MIKRLFVGSSLIFASLSLAVPAAAGPNWTAVGKAELPRYGDAQLFIDKAAPKRAGFVSGQLHAVLDRPWNNPDASGSYSDIYFRMLANCRDGTVAVQPTWPDESDTTSIRDKDLQRPPAGSASEKLLRAVCS
jgi:hypothetical protein